MLARAQCLHDDSEGPPAPSCCYACTLSLPYLEGASCRPWQQWRAAHTYVRITVRVAVLTRLTVCILLQAYNPADWLLPWHCGSCQGNAGRSTQSRRDTHAARSIWYVALRALQLALSQCHKLDWLQQGHNQRQPLACNRNEYRMLSAGDLLARRCLDLLDSYPRTHEEAAKALREAEDGSALAMSLRYNMRRRDILHRGAYGRSASSKLERT